MSGNTGDAPASGEDFLALSSKFPTGAVRAGIKNNEGYTVLSEDAFLKFFCQWRRTKTSQGVVCHSRCHRINPVR